VWVAILKPSITGKYSEKNTKNKNNLLKTTKVLKPKYNLSGDLVSEFSLLGGAICPSAPSVTPEVRVPLEVHLPIRRVTFEVSNTREIYLYTSFISKYLYIYQ